MPKLSFRDKLTIGAILIVLFVGGSAGVVLWKFFVPEMSGDFTILEAISVSQRIQSKLTKGGHKIDIVRLKKIRDGLYMADVKRDGILVQVAVEGDPSTD